jgi:hypothetical protein
MRLLHFGCLLALSGFLVLHPSGWSAEPASPPAAEPAPRPFFTGEAVFPAGRDGLSGFPHWTNGFAPWNPAPYATFGFGGLLPGDSSASAPSSSSGSMPDTATLVAGTWYNQTHAPIYQWQQMQNAMQLYQSWQAWRNARSSGPGLWLPGVGGTSGGDACLPGPHLAMLYSPMYGAARRPGYMPSQCFVAGTLIHCADGSLAPIDRLEIGQALVASEPASESVVDGFRVELRAIQRDGSIAEVVLFRTGFWVTQHEIKPGAAIPLSLPGCGYTGLVEVRRLDRVTIRAGAGVTTGIIRHPSAAVVNLHVAGMPEPIGTTPQHRFWSADRRQMVRADELLPGERLAGRTADYTFLRIEPRRIAEPVFNIEVSGFSMFHVSPAGLAVQDAGTSRR